MVGNQVDFILALGAYITFSHWYILQGYCNVWLNFERLSQIYVSEKSVKTLNSLYVIWWVRQMAKNFD